MCCGERLSIMITRACDFFQLEEGGLFQLFDLLLDNFLKGLVVYEARQLSATVLSFVISHFPLNFPVDCNGNELVKDKQASQYSAGPAI